MGSILSFFKKADDRHNLIPKGKFASNKFTHETKQHVSISERYLEINELGSIQSPLLLHKFPIEVPVLHQLSKREDDVTELESQVTSPSLSIESSRSPIPEHFLSDKSCSDNQDKPTVVMGGSNISSESEDIDVDEEHVIVFTSQ